MPVKSTDADCKAFHLAVRNYDMDTVRGMLASGMSPEIELEGVTPLFAAADHGNSGIVDLLVNAGANPNRRIRSKEGDSSGLRTALNAAADHGILSCVERLLAAGANPRSTGERRQTAAHLLISSMRYREGTRFQNASDAWLRQLRDILDRMLDGGVPINQQDQAGRTLLHNAIIEGAPEPIVDTLLRRGADPHLFDGKGLTAFHYACTGERAPQYRMLVERGADVHLAAVDGRRPIHLCDTQSSFELVLATHPDLESQDHEGRTALADCLHKWGAGSWTGKAMRLIAAGARLDTPDFDSVRPQDVIKKKKLSEVSSFVAARAARQTLAGIADAKPRP